MALIRNVAMSLLAAFVAVVGIVGFMLAIVLIERAL